MEFVTYKMSFIVTSCITWYTEILSSQLLQKGILTNKIILKSTAYNDI